MIFSLSRARLAVLSVALAAACSSFAQTSSAPVQFQETVVTANRSEQLLVDALPHTTVIGRDVIERSQAMDLPALLASEAGFQFTQNGGRGSSANLFLRGSASLQVLVLIDGVPMTKQDTTGSVSLEHITLDQVERVEIVRGNVSAIYGSGAVGGVIQVFMRKGQGKPTGFVQFEAGSYGSVRASAGVSGQIGDTSFVVGVGRQKTNGFSAMNVTQYPNENPDADGYRNTNYNLGLSHELGAGHTVGLRAEGSDGEFDTDGGGFGTPTDIYKGSSKLNTWQLYSHDQITRDWRSELSFRQGRETSGYDARLTASPYASEAVTRSRTVNWTNTVGFGAWLLTAGAESQRQAIDASDSSATQLNHERGVTAQFAGLSGTVGVHSMQFNLRRDDADGLAAETTGYAGYGFQLTPAWKLIASVSSAFNLPPLGYLYDAFSGNPALQPETARSTELGAQWAHDKRVLRATVFKTRTSNLMQYDFATWTFNNVADASNQGLEVSYSGKLDRADLRASLTLQDPVDESTGSRLIRRARTMASFGASIPMGQWTFGGDLRYTGERPDIASVPSLPAYTVANLTARFALTPAVALTARIDNLLDREYQTAYGYNQSGRAGYVGILWAPK
jgi:vitamin B12 transporter